MTASRASLLKKAQDLHIALPADRMGITAKELQALIREHQAKVKAVRKSPPKAKRPRSSANTAPAANVVAIDTARKPAVSMNRPPRPAAAFRPTAPGSKRDLMARLVLRKEGATVEDLMGVTGWSRSTTVSAIAYDLVSQMGMGVRRDGDRYFGQLPKGIPSHVRVVAPVKMAANRSK